MHRDSNNSVRPGLWIAISLGIILAFGIMFLMPGKKAAPQTSLDISTNTDATSTENSGQTVAARKTTGFFNRVKDLGNARNGDQIEVGSVNPEDLEGQLQEALEVTNQSKRHQALARIGREAAHVEEVLASQFVSLISESNSPHSQANVSTFVSNYVRESVKLDPSATAEWIEVIHDKAKGIATATLVKEWTQIDLSAASQWASNIQNDEYRNSAINTIGEMLRDSSDVVYASNWATRLGNSADGPKNAGLVAALRSRTDPQGVFDWALSLPTPESRASAFGGFAEALVKRDPTLAQEWIQQFPVQEGIREHGENMMAYQWMQSDPAAATEWSQTQTPHAPGVGTNE